MAPNNLHTTHAPDTFNWIWDDGAQEWIKQTAAAAGGGGAVTIADGADVAEGAKADAAWVSGAGSVIAILKTIASAGASAGLTDAQLRATPVPVSGTVAVTGPLTDGQLRATPVPVSGTVTASGPLTDTQLRATPVPVSGALTATDTYATANVAANWTSATALNTAITLSVLGLSTVNFSVRKTAPITVGAITIEATYDGTNYLVLPSTGARFSNSAANPYDLAAGLFPLVVQVDVAGFLSARLRLSTAITGAGSVDVRADSTAASNSTPVGTVTVAGTINQGNNNASVAQSWNVKVNDGTTGPTKVQPASTAPIATDLALTVALSPNGAIVQANAGTNLNTSALALDATLTGRTQKSQITDGTRDGTVKAASTLPLLTDTAVVTTQRDPLPAGTNVLGHVIADAGSTTAVTGNVTVVQPVPASLTATVTPIALTKNTQGATGFSVQDLRDAGRNTRIFMLDTITAAPLVEALATVVQWYGNAAVAGTTTPAVVPAGKTLRLTGYKIQYQSLATVGYAVVRIRVNTAGVAVLASPLVASFETGTNSGATTAAVTGAVTTETGSFPEGLEIPAAAGIGFSVAGYGPTGALTLEGGVRFEVHGYEY